MIDVTPVSASELVSLKRIADCAQQLIDHAGIELRDASTNILFPATQFNNLVDALNETHLAEPAQFTHPLDQCECGDFRRDHKDGTGACIFSSGSKGDGHSGAGECVQFKLHRRYLPENK